MSAAKRTSLAAFLAFAVLVALGGAAQARPAYFATFTGLYGITPSDRLYACGVCHYLWTGTGARNPFGNAVEQQLYLGKTITQSLQAVEGADTDGDGFTNLDEIASFMTLPGYSCANFFQAIGAPSDLHTFVTPLVPTCLEPLDIRVAPASVTMFVNAGSSGTLGVQLFNNGSDFPLSVASYTLLPGTHAAFSVNGPAAPFDIPVGGSATLDVVFAPPAGMLGFGTLRISSNDPDEADIDLPLTGFGILHTLAPPEERAACLKQVAGAFRKYSKRHLKEWGRCYLDEVSGLACDTGARDLSLQQAEARLRGAIGGDSDRACAPNALTPSLLGYAATCGGSCDGIMLTSLASLADCLVCRQDEAMANTLRAAIGTAPPDLPPNTVGSDDARLCQKRLSGKSERAVATVQKLLGTCELANVTAASPVDCAATLAGDLGEIETRVDAQFGRCRDTAGLLGCLIDPGTDSGCLGDAATAVGADLAGAVFPAN